MIRFVGGLPVFALLAVAAASTAAHAQIKSIPPVSSEFGALMKKLVPTRCHMGSCGWFSIEDIAPVGSTPIGTLYAVGEHSFHAEWPRDVDYNVPMPKRDGGMRVSMVFCSKTHPTTFGYYDGKWIAAGLQPGNEKAEFGYNESAYDEYFAVCHNAIINGDPKLLARRLGYQFATHDIDGDLDPPVTMPTDALNWR